MHMLQKMEDESYEDSRTYHFWEVFRDPKVKDNFFYFLFYFFTKHPQRKGGGWPPDRPLWILEATHSTVSVYILGDTKRLPALSETQQKRAP